MPGKIHHKEHEVHEEWNGVNYRMQLFPCGGTKPNNAIQRFVL